MIVDLLLWYITSDLITATASIALFLALWILPNKLYKEILSPYRYIFVILGLWFLENGSRKIINVLYVLDKAPLWLLAGAATATSILTCVALGCFVPLLKNIGILNYIESIKHEASNKFEAIFNNANEAIILASEESVITDWNEGAQKVFGFTREEALGQKLTIIMPERYRGMHLAGVQRFVKSGEKRLMGHTVRIEGLHKLGHEIPIELSLSSFIANRRNLFIAIIRDISTRKKLENENRELKEKVQSENGNVA